MGRWLRFLAACTTLPTLPGAACGGKPSFAWKPDTDFQSCDLDGSQKTATAQECAELCSTVEGCRAASWNGPESFYNDDNCNLKSCSAPITGPGLMGVVVEVAAVPATLPAEWCQDYMQADLLFTGDEDVKYPPDVGNGFVATVVGAEFVYAAGVFNGPAVSEDKPTHRAEIPAPLRLTIDAPVVGAGLHLRNGAYLRRHDVGPGVVVEMRFYAHRARRSLLVVDLTTTSVEPVEVSVTGFGGEAPDSEDFNWTAHKSVGLQATAVVWTGETREAETAEHGITRVSVVLPVAPAEPVTVVAGKPASFVAAVRTSRESKDPDSDALQDWAEAKRTGADKLYSEHTAAWARLWKSGLEVTGRLDVAREVNSSLYYLLSSLRADAPYSTSPGGLAQGGSSCYHGHVFWDAETWMYPTLMLLHPDIAASMLEYRLDTVPEAEKKAEGYGKGWKGAMFAWESAASGTETCPIQFSTGRLEQHITGDIALAAQQLWYASRNTSWLEHAAEGLVLKTADFWASRAEWSGEEAHFRTVMPPDESADQGVSDSVYTNFVAKRNLLFAEEASQTLGRTPDPAWRKTADAIVMEYDAKRRIHPEYEGYTNATIKQADVVLLGYPLLMNMSLEDRRRDLEFYAPRTDPQAPCMSWSMYVVAYLDVGDLKGAAANFEHSFANSHAPFNVWTETPDGGCVGFLTGLGGFLQTMLFGIGGLRIWRDYLAINPSLISGMTRIVIRGVSYQGAVLQISFDQDEMEVLAVKAPGAVQLTDSSGSTRSIAEGDLARVPRGSAKLRVSQGRRALRLNELRLLSV